VEPFLVVCETFLLVHLCFQLSPTAVAQFAEPLVPIANDASTGIAGAIVRCVIAGEQFARPVPYQRGQIYDHRAGSGRAAVVWAAGRCPLGPWHVAERPTGQMRAITTQCRG
jgi:hypothetical protein